MNKAKLTKDSLSLLIIFVLALLTRLFFDQYLRSHYFFYDNPSDDVLYYQQWAKEIASGDFWGDKTFFGLPLYPYFLASLFKISLGNEHVVRFFHLILGSINCVLVAVLAKRIFNKRIALTAGLLATFNFSLIYYDWIMMPVPLINSLSLLIIISFLNFSTLKSGRERIYLGILTGVAALGDGKFLLFFFLTVIYLLFKHKRTLRIFIRQSLMPLLLGVLLIICFSTFRNKIVGGDWTLISAQSGLSFYVGNNRSANGVFSNPCFIRPTHQGQDEDQILIAQMLSKRDLSSAEVSKFWKSQGLTWIKKNPKGYAKLLKNKLILIFTDTQESYDLDLIFLRDLKSMLDFNPYLFLCPLGLLGLFIAYRERRDITFINLLLISQLLFTLIFFLNNRHRVTIYPFLIILESAALLWLWDKIAAKKIKFGLLIFSLLLLWMFAFRPQTQRSNSVSFLKSDKAGAILANRRQYQKAEIEYLKALQLRPSDTNTLYNFANMFVNQGKISAAQNYYKKILQINPYHIDALYNLAFTYEQTEAENLALNLYKEVLRIRFESPDAHFRIAQIYQKQEKCTLALPHYEAVKQIQPSLVNEIQPLIDACQKP